MAGRNYKIFVESVFEPLAVAAGRPDLLPLLRTADVAPERQAEQFAKFRALQIDKSDIVYLPNGGFAALISTAGDNIVAVSSAGMNSQDELALQTWAANVGWVSTELDESTFIFLAHMLKGYYRLRDEFRSSEEALNEIDIVTDDYSGHQFTDLYRLYRPVFLFSVPADVSPYDGNIFRIGSELCVANASLRSQIIDETINSAIADLLAYSSIDSANLFQALTSAHWRYVFLEFFRVLESIFYLPWVLELKSAGGMEMRAWDLKASCRAALHWRESHKPSMERLFGMLVGNADLDSIEDQLECFKDIKNADGFKRSQLGARTYTIRNSLVHHEDYEDPTKYVLSDDQWRWLCLYLAKVVGSIYKEHERDLTPSAGVTAPAH